MPTNEELQEQLNTMREEMRQLRAHLEIPAVPVQEPRVLSRRNLLRAAPIAAIGGAVVAMTASPAAAASGDPVLLGHANSSGSATTSIAGGGNTSEAPAMSYHGGVVGDWLRLGGAENFLGNSVQSAIEDGDPLIRTVSLDCYAVEFVAGAGNGQAAGGHDLVHVQAFAPGNGITVEASDHTYGNIDGSITTRTSDGINITAGQGAGVTSAVTSGVSYEATCVDGQAITAVGTSATTSKDAVTIDYAGTSRALYAQSHNPTNINGTVTGVNEGHGIGVWGEQRNDTGTGFGVVGVAGALGRGAQFTGGAASVRLVPSTAATHPSTGKVGDLMVDSTSRLWFCSKASAGATAATWKQIA